MFRIPVSLAKGTIEQVELPLTDNTGQTSDLAGTSPSYDVLNDAGGSVVTGGTVTVSGMVMHLLVNTTIGGFVVGNHYSIYVTFHSGTETPRLGPYDLYIR